MIKGKESPSYWEEKVSVVHDAENDIGDIREAVRVANIHQHRCYNVMGEHLPMILPSFFEVEGEHLVKPRRKLDQIVPLHLATKISRRPCGPQVPEVHPVR